MCWSAKEEKGCKQAFDVSFEMQVKCMKVFNTGPEKKKMTLQPVFED
jgi:hypothetical protein